MKNMALSVSGIIFLIVAVAHYLRYHFDIAIIIGGNHVIPLDASLYGAIISLILAIWMFLAAVMRHR